MVVTCCVDKIVRGNSWLRSVCACMLAATIVLTGCDKTNSPGESAGSTTANEPATQFLELLKYAEKPKTGFDPAKTPRWDLNRIQDYLSDEGVFFNDPGERSVGQISKKEILAQLKTRKGEVYIQFAHLSFIYSQKKVSNTVTTVSAGDNTTLLTLPGWYRLTFQKGSSVPTLQKLEYLKAEAD